MRLMKRITARPDGRPGGVIPRSAGWVLLVLALLPLGAGCKGSGEKGVVAGKVTVGGKGVGPNVNVTFVGADGKPVGSAVTTGEGDYSVPEVPPGPVKITVSRPTGIGPAPIARMDPSSMPGGGSGPALPIPAKYSRPDNGLTYTVTSGSQHHDIELTP